MLAVDILQVMVDIIQVEEAVHIEEDITRIPEHTIIMENISDNKFTED